MAVEELGELKELPEALGVIEPVRRPKELRCPACGYGIVVRDEPPLCPMCGGDSWERPSWLPFRKLS